MLRPLHPDSYSDDPVVRHTIAQLRLSVVAVLVGTGICIMLAAIVAHLGYRDGYHAAGKAATLLARAESAGAGTKRRSAGAAGSRAKRLSGASATTRRKRGSARTSDARAGTSKRSSSATKGANASSAGSNEVQVTGGPSKLTLALLGAGFSMIGLGMLLVVRRPMEDARSHAAELVRTYRTLQDSTLETFAALNATVEAKDRYTAGHGLRVTLISLLIGQELELRQLELDTLRQAASFHDIGKIAVADHVLQKPGRLTDQEFEAMKVHPVESARICSKLAVLRDAVPAIRGHHERMDGRGYPDGLIGDAIPLGARIIAVADTWDAITSDRPYRRGQPAAVALDEVRRVSGSQFDPRVVRAFVEVLAKDPWMFGLTPEDVLSDPAAPGRTIEVPSRSSEAHHVVALGEGVAQRIDVDGPIDWTTDFEFGDSEDAAA